MDFSDYPTTGERKISHKAIAIVVGGVILAVVVIGVVIRIFSSEKSVDFETQQQESISALLDQCNQTSNADACRRDVIDETVKNSGTPDACGTLEGEDADGCVTKFAREQARPEACEAIEDEPRRTACKDNAYYSVAESTSDISQCDNIEDIFLKQSCRLNLEPELTSENCLSLGRSETECQLVSVVEQANEKRDRAVCRELPTQAFVDTCLDMVETQDPDLDNIPSSLEPFYGTDPANPDTDADGYNDGDEVAAGYDPSGPGKLE